MFRRGSPRGGGGATRASAELGDVSIANMSALRVSLSEVRRDDRIQWFEFLRVRLFITTSLSLSAAAGCAGPARQRAVPLELQDRAVISGLSPAVRTWGASVNREFQQELFASVRREREFRASSGQTGPLPPAEYLAISGGGPNGAFAAGLLNGWTAAGNRPQFKAVTGISTGALIAPFAFLGPDYDETLREVYTEITTKDILTKRNRWPPFSMMR